MPGPEGWDGGFGGGLGMPGPGGMTVGAAPEKALFQNFCSPDQISETFSDWMAAEITPDYIDKNFPKLTTEQKRFGYSNIWRGDCTNESHSGAADPHPHIIDRNNRILLPQPKIRSQMNCPQPLKDRVYCTVGNRTSNLPESKSTPTGVAK